LLAFGTIGGIASAASWLGNSASYTTSTEWDTGVVPAVTTDVTISAGTATNAGNLTRNGNTTVSGTGNLVITNGRFLSGGTITVRDSGAINQTGNYFLVGNTSRGTLNQLGGSISATVDRGFFLSDNAGGAGSTYNLNGGTLAVVSNGSGSDVNLFAVHIGKGGVGDVFNIDGGAATFTAVTASRNVWLSRQSLFNLVSGSAIFSGYEKFTIGFDGTQGATSLLQIRGGTFEVHNELNAFTLGAVENGSVALSGGTMKIDQTILLGGAGGVTGSFTMTGGQLFANDIQPGPGLAQFSFSGGDVFLVGDRTGIVNQSWFQAPSGVQAAFDAGTNQTHLSAVPEPSTAIMFGVSGLALLARRRRQPMA
jgi:hypothetical protein